jgi:hypothetical protein
LIVVSAAPEAPDGECEAEKWRSLFFCLSFFCPVAETAINAKFRQ